MDAMIYRVNQGQNRGSLQNILYWRLDSNLARELDLWHFRSCQPALCTGIRIPWTISILYVVTKAESNCCKLLFKTMEDETKEVTASPAAAKQTSVVAALTVFSSEQDCTFAFKEKQRTVLKVFLVGQYFSFYFYFGKNPYGDRECNKDMKCPGIFLIQLNDWLYLIKSQSNV